MNCMRSMCLSVGIMCMPHCALANLKDAKLFIKSALKNPCVVGAVLPSCHGVGEELVRYVLHSQRENPGKSLRILEIGAGTGSMSAVIASHLRACDHVDLVEISPDFCQILHDKFDAYDNVSVQCLSILDWDPAEHYDFIISTLPFNSFTYDLMDKILNHITHLIKKDGVVSYVAYVGISDLIKHCTWGERKANHVKKMKRLEQWRSHRLIAKKTILKNMPPINIFHLRFT